MLAEIEPIVDDGAVMLRTICRPNSWQQCQTPLMLTSITKSHSSAVTSEGEGPMNTRARVVHQHVDLT